VGLGWRKKWNRRATFDSIGAFDSFERIEAEVVVRKVMSLVELVWLALVVMIE
jgi:hypothetical protein